jgi:tyrosine decarboxylase / aspartate 1-decarboxylase
MKTTKLLADGIEGAGFKLVVEPTLNILAFKSGDTELLAEKLCRKGWFVSYVSRYDCIRIVVMPHVKKQHAIAFLKDLSE